MTDLEFIKLVKEYYDVIKIRRLPNAYELDIKCGKHKYTFRYLADKYGYKYADDILKRLSKEIHQNIDYSYKHRFIEDSWNAGGV